MQRSNLKNQNGLTLVEVLVSILILSIIIVTFLTFFIQSEKNTNVSEDVLDASYVAQTQLERLYYESETLNYDAFIQFIRSQADSYQSIKDLEKVVRFEKEFKVETVVQPAKNQDNEVIHDLYAVIVKVYDQNSNLKAQMETKLFFEGQEE
ncbi:hypothetical protein BN1058_02361 [Paraliobacillus sp. PM-2]|uniref:prepilin-type N-terminal cleavage/methylation domain-containing protein n=1 Tax=Paraliobacillus sp. PM-2 TaxID=1462524 RepID=UPI00061BF5E9|nr:prepilin-type N-terminal cleavage/methylation domain-containing protein [Paraliobacillus sp. PM-2]CQR48021.1 hypothetical protein BN1058_02361 [Paraliobacillus sp. PM-2]